MKKLRIEWIRLYIEWDFIAKIVEEEEVGQQQQLFLLKLAHLYIC